MRIERKFSGRGAFRYQRRYAVRRAGDSGKANVGMSNDNACEKHAHRKTKVSCINANRIRVSRVLRGQRKRAFDGKQVNIPALIALSDAGTE